MFTENSIVGIAGAGVMGVGIAQVAAQSGHRVIVVDGEQSAIERGRNALKDSVSALLERNKVTEAAAREIEARVEWTLEVGALSEASIVVEAIIEDIDAKQALYKIIEDVVSENALIATNTSSLSIAELSSNFRMPGRFLGMHFFNPATKMKLVEVVAGLSTSESMISAAFDLIEFWGKDPVIARDVPGFIVNRVARPFYAEGWRACEEGVADASTIDFLYRDLAGLRMGPFELGDLIGHDVNYEAARSIFEGSYGDTRFRPSIMQRQFVCAGRLGRKSGQGVFNYSNGADTPGPSFYPAACEKLESIRVSAASTWLRRVLDECHSEYAIAQDLGHGMEAEIDGVGVWVTHGVTAERLSHESGRAVIVLDWIADPNSAAAFAFAASSTEAQNVAARLAATVGKKAVELSDRPGLVIFRMLAQMVNAGADAVRDRVADVATIDIAMTRGINLPIGLFEWAYRVDMQHLCNALQEIANGTGDEIYRPNEVLQAMARDVRN